MFKWIGLYGLYIYIYLCHLFVLAATNIRGSHPMIKISLSDATFVIIIMNHYMVLGKIGRAHV